MRAIFLLALLLPLSVFSKIELDFSEKTGADGSQIETSQGVIFDNYALLSFADAGKLFTIDSSSPNKQVKMTVPDTFYSLSFQVKSSDSDAVNGWVATYSADGAELARQTFQGDDTLSNDIAVVFEGLAEYAIFTSTDADSSRVNFDNIQINAIDQPDTNTCTGAYCTTVNNGKCTADGVCSCYSGFSGKQCQVNPPFNFAPQTVEQSQSFHHNVHYDLGTSVVFTVSIPSMVSIGNKGTQHSYSTTTLLTFGGDQSKKCDFPQNPNWVLKSVLDTETAQWMDTYTNDFSYKDLYDCGLRMTDTLNGVTHFNNTITIEKDYVVSNGRMKFDRNIKVPQQFSVGFPTVVSVIKQVEVNPPKSMSSWLDLSFDTINQKWHIIIGAAVEWPFKLDLINDPVQGSPLSSRNFVKVGESVDPICSEFGTIASCLQTYEFTVDSCEVVEISNFVLKFNLICRSDSPRACSAESSITTAGITLTTTSACPLSKEVDVGDIHLDAISKVQDTNGLKYFGYSQDAHFTVDFDEPAAKLSQVSISAVCAFPLSEKNNIKGSCPDKWVVDNSDVTLEDKGSHKLAFYIRAKKINDAAQVTGFSNTLVLQVDIILDYTGTFKRSVDHSRSGNMLLVVKNDGTNGTPALAQKIDKSSASKNTGVLLFSLIALLAFLI